MTVAIGIDPGGTNTGIILRDDDELLDAVLLTRPDGQDDAKWVGRVVEDVWHAIRLTWDAAAGARLPLVAPLVSVEAVNPPTGRMGMISLDGLLRTAAVYGAVLAEFPEAIVVSPGGHGSAPLAAYPQALRRAGEISGRGGKYRHCRSAWDIAGAALFLDRIGIR